MAPPGDRGVEGIAGLADIPHDPSLAEWEAAGRSFLEMPGDSPAANAVEIAVRALFAEGAR